MRTIAIIKRDLKKFFRNPLILGASIIMPVIYLIIVGNTVQGELKNIPIVVVDQDHGYYARRILELIQAIEAGTKTIKATYHNDSKYAYKQVEDGIYSALIIIPPDFTKRVIRAEEPRIGMFLDNVDIFSANAVYGSITKAISYTTKEYIPIRVKSNSPVLSSVDIYRKLDYDQSLIPGVVIMAIFMGAMGTGVFNLIMDRFLGVHESYLATPLNKWNIVCGLIISGVILTTGIAVFVFIISSLITEVTFINIGIYIMIIGIILLTALGLLGMMFLILSRVDHPRIVGIFGGFMNVIFFFPSGAIYPIASFPKWLQVFAKINPEAYAVHALRSLMFKDGNISAIKYDLIFLICFTIIMVFMATLTFKRTL